MGSYILPVAQFFGLDPFTFGLLGLLASIFAFSMKAMMPNPWMAFAFYPTLLLGGLIMAAIVTATGLATPIDIRIDSDGDYRADWTEVAAALPTVVLAGVTGMCGVAVGILRLAKSMDKYV